MRKKKPVFDFKKMINLEYPSEYYVALIFGLFFLIVSFNKILDPHAFAEAIFRGHLMPSALINILALLFMSLELSLRLLWSLWRNIAEPDFGFW